MKSIFVVILTLLLSACISAPKVYRSKFDGHCLALVDNVKLWKIDTVARSYYILANRTEWNNTESLIAELSPGTKLMVEQVILGANAG
ncbi:hypothetical protein [Endozoicomonas numazuensis]|nr:hypothetical protein [Endozoicomonas numazuensis]